MAKTFTQNDLSFFLSAADLRSWLVKNGQTALDLQIGFYKKASGKQAIGYDEVLDEALCYGWIDGIKNAVDDESYTVRFTPRGPRSIWSKRNVGHIQRLTESGRMTQAGLAVVEAAKADGRWQQAYDSGKTAQLPHDLTVFLDTHPQAKEFYDGMSAANRYAIIFRLQTAKKPLTRARRFEQITQMLEDGEVFYP